ncbi:MAG: hypothetical protein A4E42_01585 [Methanoregulaceae archaeon PtaU1.Bin222]|nr:MAG: hypothetical protein A4E42_01585 [Methanoregulaceae archaeon PtaU1.Bin222]
MIGNGSQPDPGPDATADLLHPLGYGMMPFVASTFGSILESSRDRQHLDHPVHLRQDKRPPKLCAAHTIKRLHPLLLGAVIEDHRMENRNTDLPEGLNRCGGIRRKR